MNLLYYSKALNASHGGRIHARSFVQELSSDARIDKVITVPKIKDEFSIGNNKSVHSAWKALLPFRNVLALLKVNLLCLHDVLRTIHRERPDVVICRVNANFLQIPLLKWTYPDIPLAVEVNGSPFDEYMSETAGGVFWSKLERYCLSYSDRNFFISDVLRKSMMGNHLDSTRDYVLYNGVDISLFRKQNKNTWPTKIKSENNVITLGYVGSLVESKNVSQLIKAVEELKDRGYAARLIVVGDGEVLDNLKALSAELDLQGDIEFTGRVPHKEVPDQIARFDVAIHHYAEEYMCPLKLFEYMAVGVPVIGPDTVAVKEIFDHGVHLLLTNGEPVDIAERVIQVKRDNALSERIATAGQDLVRTNFTWRDNTNKVVSQLKKLV